MGRAAATAGALATLTSTIAPSVAQAGVVQQARLNGKLQVVQVLDFHPDHNAHNKKVIEDWAASTIGPQNLDLSDLAGFLGSSNIYEKLQAQKQAGQPVDVIFHGLSARLLQLYELTRDATPQVNRMVERYGRPYSSARAGHQIGGKWIGLPFYDRVGGCYVRTDKMAEAGYPVESGVTEHWFTMIEAARAMSNPAQNFYGWGFTVNRSGDGQSLVNNTMWAWGGALADPTGEIVTLFSPETIDAMTWLTDIYMNPVNANMVAPGVNAWNDLSNNEAWLAGTIGFTSNAGTLYAKSVVDGTTTPEGGLLHEVTRLIQWPLGPFGTRLQGSGGHYFYYMNGSQNYDVATQLTDHMLSDEVQVKLWEISPGYVVPAYENRWEHPIIQSNPNSVAFQPVAFNDPPFQGVSYRGPLSEAADAVESQSVQTDMVGEVLAGKPVIAAVRDAHLRCVDIYQSFGYKGR